MNEKLIVNPKMMTDQQYIKMLSEHGEKLISKILIIENTRYHYKSLTPFCFTFHEVDDRDHFIKDGRRLKITFEEQKPRYRLDEDGDIINVEEIK